MEGFNHHDNEILEQYKDVITNYALKITTAGDRYVVRDPLSKKKCEGGSLQSMIVQAKTAHEDAEKGATAKAKAKAAEAKKAKAASTPPKSKEANPAPSNGSATQVPQAPAPVPAPRPAPVKKQRDMTLMNIVYDAVLGGMKPSDCYMLLKDTLPAGMKFVSDTSVYTHAAIAKRVRDRALDNGWTPPTKKDDAPKEE